jgi:hypothetical protein
MKHLPNKQGIANKNYKPVVNGFTLVVVAKVTTIV